MQLLRANTQVKVVIGPVVAVGDGFTPVTTLSVSTADEAEIMKHDAASVTDISGATFTAITSADGYYNLTLTTSHTDTEGLLTVLINDDSLCLPVKQTFMVLAEAAYDSMFVAKDDGFMDVNIKTVGRADTQETEATNLEAACAAYSATRGLAGTALPAAAADAAGGLPISDAGGLDLDAQRSDVAAILVDTGTTLQGELDGIQADTEDIQTRIPAALVGGRIDATVDGTGMEAGAVTAIQSGLATSSALATAQADLDLLTGTDGATLATSQPNYAPATAASLATTDGKVDTLTTTVGAAGAGLTEAGGTGDHLTALATQASVDTIDGIVDAILLDTGTDGVAISSTVREAIATSLLDLANGVESGITTRQALRAMAAILSGLVSGAGTGTEVFKGIGQASGGTTRVTNTVDSSGNRSAATLNL